MKTKRLLPLLGITALLASFNLALADSFEITASNPKNLGSKDQLVRAVLEKIEHHQEWIELLTGFDRALPESSLKKRTTRFYHHVEDDSNDLIKVDWHGKDAVVVTIGFDSSSDCFESVEKLKESLVAIMNKNFDQVRIQIINPKIAT